MHYQLIGHGQGSRTWSIVLDRGEEVGRCLQDFARRELLSTTSFTAAGAFERAVLGHRDVGRQGYRREALDRPMRVVSLVGAISLRQGKPHVRMRAALADGPAATLDGHLLEARVGPQLKVIMTEAPVALHKDYDADAGLALLHSGESMS